MRRYYWGIATVASVGRALVPAVGVRGVWGISRSGREVDQWSASSGGLVATLVDEERQEPIARKMVPLSISGSTLYEGDYAVHFERGVCMYAGRWQEGEQTAETSWPVLLRFADRVVAVSADEASGQLTLLRRGSEAETNDGSIDGMPSSQGNGEDLPPIYGLKARPGESPIEDESKPKLSRLRQQGSWLSRRRKAMAVSREHARELVALAAARKARRREPCAALSNDRRETLDRGLGFPLTEGQERCVAAIEEDMCRRVEPMDRLVFGDVGYGKTEVALRAIATAAQNGRQSALVAPTTILATQHFHTLKSRLGPLGIRVELLLGVSRQPSTGEGRRTGRRSRTGAVRDARAENARVKLAIASGECDVAIGTHALLSPRQAWRRLGLAVVDEEQRFGVTQKEQLKRACVQVDVLTLSATPIPRTLGAALVGIRDCSELPKPPPGRGTTKTVVSADEIGSSSAEERLANLFGREFARGGQCFYVVPHIADVQGAVARITKLLVRLDNPGAILVAHGGVPDPAAVVADFARGDNATRPVLVATSLVENGLDLPSVNTIVVQDAHRFGLASLHQLRGRVGRGDRAAVACFLYPQNRPLSPAARARLVAISNARLAGPDLARRDLEIRGAGALLGTRQSGRVSRVVGTELYAKLLVDELNRLRALAVAPVDECAADVPLARALRRRECFVFDSGTTLADVHEFRDAQIDLTPQAKAAIKLRLLEIHAARLGFDRVALADRTPQGDENEAVPASALVRAPSLEPPSWDVLVAEVPDALRSNLRFDQPNATVEVVRLGALEPVKQVDFLLEVFIHMTTFLDRVTNTTAPNDANNATAALPSPEDDGPSS